MPVIKAHFETYRHLPKWPFLWRITLEGLILSLLAAVVLKLVFHVPPRPPLPEHGIWLLLSVVVVAPFVETLLCQTIPVAVARLVGLGFWRQVIVSTAVFAGMHFLAAGIGSGIAAGVVGGFYIAFTYVRWREVSFRSALWMTSGSHALHNLFAMTLILHG